MHTIYLPTTLKNNSKKRINWSNTLTVNVHVTYHDYSVSLVTTLNLGEPCMFEMLCKTWRIETHSWVLNHYVVNDLFNVCSCVCRKYRDNIEWVWSESCKYGLIRHRLQIYFFVTIFISFFTCTCYRYKTFIQYQKKKERKEKHTAKGKNRRVQI